MNLYLIVSGIFSAIAALIHIGCIYFGASWYRFFGASEQIASWAEQGNIKSTIITSSITLVLSIWSAYAFSAAGMIPKLPFMKLVMVTITSIYLLRGVGGFFLMSNPMGRSSEFWLWSSLICLIVGIFHAVGLKQEWSNII